MYRISLFVCLLFGSLLTAQATFETKTFMDLAYSSSDDTLQQLNLIVPITEKAPLFIWIGGGAWSYVDKDVEMDFGQKMAQSGIAFASIGHRLSPAVWRDPKLDSGVQHPAHVEDLAKAVHWLCQHAKKYGYNKDQLFIGGYSSGAQLATLLVMDSTYLAKYKLSPQIFRGVLPFSGVYDIPAYHEVFANGPRPEMAEQHVEAVFGESQEQMENASPVQFLEHLKTPMLVFCDNNLYNYTRLWEDRVRATEFRDMQVIYAYDLSHGGLWKNLSFAENSIYRAHILHFIQQHIGSASNAG